METYSQKDVAFMHFWLNYCDENHIKRIPVAVKDIDHLFNMASEIIKADRLHLFLRHPTWWWWIPRKPRKRYRINYLHGKTNLEIVDLFWIEKILKPQKHLISVRYWIFYITPDCFLTSMFIEAVLSSNNSCSKCFLIVFTYHFEQAKRVWNEWGEDKLDFPHKQFMIIYGRI